MADKAWKRLERSFARLVGGRRVIRMGDWSQSAPDVIVDGLPWIKVDCKYRKSHRIHALFREVRRRYCKTPQDRAILVTRESGRKLVLVTIEAELFAEMLNAYKKSLKK